ncbi:MAG: hypothetical protein R3280_03145 [Marinobacter sp.]|uniref:hypothetical protein n=1 Tax=Marinobacter sp. TaxID=50741 RepID=UPI00299D00E4|nr:hypothetical protein [Marinobacter sp.]MDX1633611.1 hypothetical protein [Marinobacter sp.]
MSVVSQINAELEQLPAAARQQVLEYARALRQGLEHSAARSEAETEDAEQVERQSTLGHS